MEENRERIKGILGKASDRKAPAHLSHSIMEAWKEEEKPLVIAPLISKPVWIMLSVALIGLLIWIFNSEPKGSTSTPLLDFLKETSSSWNFDLTLNPVAMLSIVVMVFMIWVNVLIVSGRVSMNRFSIL